MKPKISIVTPSFNQGQFLEETLRSVLDQNYPNLEYVVMDGGSTDQSPEILRRYSDRLSHWVSEKDGGQFDAINRGFARTSGEIMGWLNSDDKYMPWALEAVSQIFAEHPEIEWLTTSYSMTWSERGHGGYCWYSSGFEQRSFLRGANLMSGRWYARGFIQQESTFWRRSLWERSGGKLDASLRGAGDFELWTRFFKHAELHSAVLPLGGFRIQPNQKTSVDQKGYNDECERVLRRNGGRPYGAIESSVRHAFGPELGAVLDHLLPRTLLRLLVRLGVVYRVPVVYWHGERWHRRSEYLF